MNDPEKILLILDLDETLIYATEIPLGVQEDHNFDQYKIYKRPHLDWFLNEVKSDFKIAIWSSADDEYVAQIVDNIKPKDFEFDFVWGRSKCTYCRDYNLDEYYWEKRLKKVKNKGFKLEKILIVDDTPSKSRDNFGNAIYIKEFTGQQDDIELNELYKYLKTIQDAENVRAVEKRGWRNTNELIDGRSGTLPTS